MSDWDIGSVRSNEDENFRASTAPPPSVRILAVVYILLHITFFLAAQVPAIALPSILAIHLSEFLEAHFGRVPYLQLIVPAGLSGSLATVLWLFNDIGFGLKYNFGVHPGVSYSSPKLELLVARVADKVGIPRFDSIRVTAGTQVSTYYVGQRSLLVVGLLTLKFLSSAELAAIIAHECAHHHNGAMVPNRAHHRATMFMLGFTTRVNERLEVDGDRLIYYRGYGAGVEFAMLGHRLALGLYRIAAALLAGIVSQRRHEYYCDQVAAQAVGPDPLKSALRTLNDLALAQATPAATAARGTKWLHVVEREYRSTLDSCGRYQHDWESTETHPPLAARLADIEKCPSKTTEFVDASDHEPFESARIINEHWRRLFARDEHDNHVEGG